MAAATAMAPITIPAIAPPESLLWPEVGGVVVAVAVVDEELVGVNVTVAGFIADADRGAPVWDGRVSPVGKRSPGTTIYSAFLASSFCFARDTDLFCFYDQLT